MAKMPASRLQTLLEDHVRGAGSTLSFSGVSIHATCTNHRPRVTLTDAKGVEIPKDRVLTVVGSDFLFTGGDAFWGHEPAPPYTERSDLLRDAMVAVLRKKTTLDPANYLKTQRRFVVSERPLQCD
jgi:hypothetical protein